MTTIYILLPLSRGIYNLYANANEQHINHIRCENISLYFFSRNRTTILKQALIQSTARILHSQLIKRKQGPLGSWDSQKKKANRNGICINLYKQDHLVYSYICHFLRLQNFNLQKCKYFSRNVEHTRSFYIFEKDLLTIFTKMSTIKKTLFVFSFVFACLGSRSFRRVMRVLFVLVFVIVLFVFVFAFV